jgi:hypothetical protein
VRSLAVVLFGAAALVFGCGTTQAAPKTDLRITVWPEGRGAGAPSRTRTLRCEPAGGTLARPAAACRQLYANRSALRPVRPDVICTQVYGGPEVAHIRGVLRGTRVSAWLKRTDGCEIDRWNRLSALLRG